jgi:3-deoxy-manno-octulosonate cytidylyltransferase (CMP-KDO synthetase)
VPESQSVIGVIPSRYGSTRFPGKPLARIAGKPMIEHVYRKAVQARRLSRVVVATDDRRILEAVKAFGGEAVMTSPDHPTGTDRVAEVATAVDAAHFVNIQGDEPLIDPGHIDMCADGLLAGESMVTLAARITTRSDVFDQNVVKVAVSRDGHALYFSRSAIPFPRKYLDAGSDVDIDSSTYLRHIGVYGYTRSSLESLAQEGPIEMEEMEALEQLRALAIGIKIKVVVVGGTSLCVDVPEDIGKVESLLRTGDGV